MTFYEILEQLEQTGHEELWLMTADNGVSYKRDPFFPSSWLHPKIVTRDGRVIADRIAKPNDWSLCGNFLTIAVRPGCAAPYLSISLKEIIRGIREERILGAILPGESHGNEKPRL